VFTEHRDTLHYLVRKIGAILGRPGAVQAIHGGVHRAQRRTIVEEFTQNDDCRVLIATDAAGEGLNLQAAHLMVNYDLPWNPNRIEQRFGRIHRIGQLDVCRLWNLVATDTREGDVFARLLEKLEQQRKAYGDKVFDVLGSAFTEEPLRDLLIRAIRYGDLPETKAQMDRVIAKVPDEIESLLAEQALAREVLARTDLERLRGAMDEARARRLQPHYVDWEFRHAFRRLGGQLRRREQGRFEITNVPARVRTRARGPLATRYDRVTFDIEHVQAEDRTRAELIAPGHPLHDAVAEQVIEQWGDVLQRGTVLISPDLSTPQVLVAVIEEIADATEATVARRFGYAFVDEHGQVRPAGPAPYLDCVAAPDGVEVDQARALPWLALAEQQALSGIIAGQLPRFLAETRQLREAELLRARGHVDDRLRQERERLIAASMAAEENQKLGKHVRESPMTLLTRAGDLEARRETRLALIDRQLQMQARPPRIATAALVLPLAAVRDELPADAPIRAVATEAVERRGIELVLASERALGREPIEQAHNNPGFDILSALPDEDPIRIEVKARIRGSEDFYVTQNEVVTGLNSAPHHRLALVAVDPSGPDYDEVRYVADAFRGYDPGRLAVDGTRVDWRKTWDSGREPF
jgi:hypothetical protein